MAGRFLFRVHCDNAANDASHGYIMMPRAVRDAMPTNGTLTVTQ
jgi:hypothetical protein